MAYKKAYLHLINYCTARLLRVTVTAENGAVELSKGKRLPAIKKAVESLEVAKLHIFDRHDQPHGSALVVLKNKPTDTVEKFTDNKLFNTWFSAFNKTK